MKERKRLLNYCFKLLLIDITIVIANKFVAKRKKEVVGCLRMNPISEERMAGERKKRDERKKERERERENGGENRRMLDRSAWLGRS